MAVQNINTGEILEKEPTQELANQGFVPVLTPEKMSNATPIKINEPEQTPTYDISGLQVPELQMTEEEKQESDFSKRIRDINLELTGESAYRAEQESKQGLGELLKTQKDLSSQLTALQNEAKQIPLQLQQEATGKGITAGGLAPLQTARIRTNAIQALGVSSLLQASQGNIALAQTMVDRAVEQEYAPKKAERDALIKNLELIRQSPEYSLADKNRAAKQLEIQKQLDQQDEEKKAEKKEIWSMANEAASNGADALTLDRISKATTKEEALRLASPYMTTELEQQKFENSLKTGEFNLKKQNIENDLKQQAFENNVTLEKLELDRAQFASDQEYRNAQLVLDRMKQERASFETEYVKIGDKTYQKNPDGSLTTPEVPQEIAEATMLQREAGEKARELLDNISKASLGKSRYLGSQLVKGTDAYTFDVGFNNLIAKLQLDSVKYLKGQGQITENERKILRDAVSDLDTGLKPDVFKRKLQDITIVLGSPGELETKDDGTYIYKNLDGTVHKGRLGDNYKDITVPKLDLNFSSVGGDTETAIKTEKVGNKNITASGEILSRLKLADDEFFEATGKHIDVNQSYRTKEQQAALYEKLSKTGARVAPAGESFHEKGMAIDVTNWKDAQKYLRKYGLLNNLADDKGHFSYGEFA